MSGFFNPDNWFWKFFGKAFDFFGLSCMWLLSSMFLITLVWAVIFFVLWTGFQIVSQMGMAVLTVAYYFSMVVPAGILCWLIPIQSRFVYSFGQLHKMAFIFALRHLPSTLAILALALVTVEICINFPFFVIFLPGIVVYCQSFFIEKVFQKYMPEEENAED